MMFAKTFLLILSLICNLRAYKILVYYPTPSYSHQRGILSLSERLVKDGHELFVISPSVVPGLLHHRNYTYVDLSYSNAYFSEGESDKSVNLQRPFSKWELLKVFTPIYDLVQDQLRTENFLKFKQYVESNRIKFDVVIGESFYTPFTCGLTRVFTGSAPIITMITLTTDYIMEDDLGSITHLSFLPSNFDHYGYTSRMSLWQKIENWFSDYYLVSSIKEMMDSAARSYFSEIYGSKSEKLLDKCWKNTSLTLVTSNPLYFYPRALGPNVIEVGPLHITAPKNLSKNLQTWLDGAEKGVIYFSLGSNMKSKSLPGDVRVNFLKFFKELPPGYRVLWKWELDGKIPGQPENVLTQKWFPQDSVLAHPNVKVFIMQGGVQSFQEAVHFGVPMVGIPWFGDQHANIAKIVDAEIGVRLLPKELHSYDRIKSVLEAVLYDESVQVLRCYVPFLSEKACFLKDFGFKVDHCKYNTLEFLMSKLKSDTPKLQSGGVVYQILCADRDISYIGQTKQLLAKNLNGHKYNRKEVTALHIHEDQLQHKYDFENVFSEYEKAFKDIPRFYFSKHGPSRLLGESRGKTWWSISFTASNC